MTPGLDRLARLAGLIRQVRVGAAGAAQARAAALRDDLAAPALTTPPAGCDPDAAAQHARWAASRRRVLAAGLAHAEHEAAQKAAAACRAIGTDQAIASLGARLAEEDRRKARRG